MTTIYARYHAKDWAEGKSIEEIKKEIYRLDNPRNFQWNEVGNAHMVYVRIQCLKAILLERLECI